MTTKEDVLKYFIKGLIRERNILLWLEKEIDANFVVMFGRENEFNEGVMFLKGFDNFINKFSIPENIINTKCADGRKVREFTLSGIRFFTEQEVAV